MKTFIERYENTPIEELGIIWPFSGSEVSTASCPRLYSYQYVEGLKVGRSGNALYFGIIFHEFLHAYLETTYENDSPPTLRGAYKVYQDGIEGWLSEHSDAFSSEEERLNIKNQIEVTIPVWIPYWKEVHKRFKIIDLETTLYSPVLFPSTNTSFAPLVKVFKEQGRFFDEGDRLLPVTTQINNKGEIFELNIPWYRVGRADVIMLERSTNTIWIGDHKTTGSVSMFMRRSEYSAQLVNYASMLRYMLKNTSLRENPRFKPYIDLSIEGGFYAIYSNKLKRPEPSIKNDVISLSVSKSRFFHSVLYRQVVIKNKLQDQKYFDHIEWYRENSDQKFCDFEEKHISEEDMNRVQSEFFGQARYLSGMRSNIAEISTDEQYQSTCYRAYTQCSQWGSCVFSSNCLQNNSYSDILSIEAEPKISWTIPSNWSPDKK